MYHRMYFHILRPTVSSGKSTKRFHFELGLEVMLHLLKIDDLEGLDVKAGPFDEGTTSACANT